MILRWRVGEIIIGGGSVCVGSGGVGLLVLQEFVKLKDRSCDAYLAFCEPFIDCIGACGAIFSFQLRKYGHFV